MSEWENDSWFQLTDGKLFHLVEAVSGIDHTAFGRLVVLAEGHAMPQIG